MTMLREESERTAHGLLKIEIDRLAHLIFDLTRHDGTFNTNISGLYLNRYSRMDAEQVVHAINAPFMGIVAQGEKEIIIGNDTYLYGGSRIFISPVALPFALQITHASYSKPFLAIGLILDPQKIGEWVLKLYPQGLPTVNQRKPGYVVNADFGILHSITRLVECMSDSIDVELLAPLIMDEILIRLLRSSIGVKVAEMGVSDSSVQRISRAIAWLQDHFSQQIKLADLADFVHMSVSSFSEHFKSVTSMSPIQYQKALRLQKARGLMLSKQMDATEACRLVGYVSDSQFNRDYSRLFGNPPVRDIMRLRQQAKTQ